LPRFPINTLKIDRSFVNRMTSDAESLEIVRAITMLAQSIGIEVIAEGVETLQQLLQLKTIGCEFGQGYWFARPLESALAQKMLTKPTQWLLEG
jgi:EAL domain-containing protein (putative c-di-GMP-specific phosphodiesterase class I)